MTIHPEDQPVKTSGRPGKYNHLYMIRCLGSLEFGSLEFMRGRLQYFESDSEPPRVCLYR